MPIPSNLKKKYSIIIATATKRAESKGMSKAKAKSYGKRIAEKFVSDRSK